MMAGEEKKKLTKKQLEKVTGGAHVAMGSIDEIMSDMEEQQGLPRDYRLISFQDTGTGGGNGEILSPKPKK